MCVFCVRIRLVFSKSCPFIAYVYGVFTALSGFRVCILLFVRYERLCIRIRLICCDFWCRPHDSLKFSMIRSWGFFDLLLSMWTLVICCKSGRSDLEGPFIYFSARAVCYCWTISRIAFFGFCQVLFLRELFVMIGPSEGSDLKGSVEFFFRKSACDSSSIITSKVSCWSWQSNIYISVE